MWLINTATEELERTPFYEPDIPEYAILSHTWGDDEVSYPDMGNLAIAKSRKGWDKVRSTCSQARLHGLQYAWVDTCCIDKSSSAELSEAINSMFSWYQQATKCYVYLFDFEEGSEGKDHLPECRWFGRGWTLQELLAPRDILFYDQSWQNFGTKMELCNLLSQITSIPVGAISGDVPLSYYSIAQRMSWAASRSTTRIEDVAYSLLGIFDVHIPLLYGEKHRAFFRLQEEIIKNTLDMTLLAWESTQDDFEGDFCSVIARSPSSFKNSGNVRSFGREDRICTLTSRGLQLTDRPPERMFQGRDYYIDIGKTGSKPDQQIVSLAVGMTGPGLYVRNGYLPLGLYRNYSIRRPLFSFNKPSYMIHFATRPHQAYHRIKHSIHIVLCPSLSITDALPRKYWNEISNLFYVSRESTQRLLHLNYTIDGHRFQPMLLVSHGSHGLSCIIFELEEHPVEAARLLNYVWAGHNELQYTEFPEIFKHGCKLSLQYNEVAITIEATANMVVKEQISPKDIWEVAVTCSQTVSP